MKLKCTVCNEVIDLEDMYEVTKNYYAKTDVEVQQIGFNKKGKLKVKHSYICPNCKHIVGGTSLAVVHESV